MMPSCLITAKPAVNTCDSWSPQAVPHFGVFKQRSLRRRGSRAPGGILHALVDCTTWTPQHIDQAAAMSGEAASGDAIEPAEKKQNGRWHVAEQVHCRDNWQSLSSSGGSASTAAPQTQSGEAAPHGCTRAGGQPCVVGRFTMLQADSGLQEPGSVVFAVAHVSAQRCCSMRAFAFV